MHFSRLVTLVILGAAACSSGARAPNDGGGETDFAALIAQYSTWTQRTDKPVSISNDIFALCRSPTLPEQTFVDSEHGRHRYLLDWLNPGAVTGFAAQGSKPFPVGAAIVKEKLVSTASGYELAARGIMVKRMPGFDVKHVDWDFAYWEPSSGVVSGSDQSQYCAGCHASAASTDFIFLDDSWRRP
ncbi:MAG TPA: cytochrome P460 family protein [Polyangia bacterium]|nr:cytochrome P460 family protein [Polyangia bacterium]